MSLDALIKKINKSYGMTALFKRRSLRSSTFVNVSRRVFLALILLLVRNTSWYDYYS